MHAPLKDVLISHQVACCDLVPPIPDFPTEWSATVEANIVNQGYTYVQKETYSQTQVGALGTNVLSSRCIPSSKGVYAAVPLALLWLLLQQAAAGTLDPNWTACADAPSLAASCMLWCHSPLARLPHILKASFDHMASCKANVLNRPT